MVIHALLAPARPCCGHALLRPCTSTTNLAARNFVEAPALLFNHNKGKRSLSARNLVKADIFTTNLLDPTFFVRSESESGMSHCYLGILPRIKPRAVKILLPHVVTLTDVLSEM